MNKFFLFFSVLTLCTACASHGSVDMPSHDGVSEDLTELKIPFVRMGFIEPLENDTYAKKTEQGIQNWNNEETVIKFFVKEEKKIRSNIRKCLICVFMISNGFLTQQLI